GTTVGLGLVSEDGKVKEKKSLSTASLKDRSLFFACIVDYLQKIVNKGIPILGIGVGAPGIIDVKKGFIFELTNIAGWTEIPFSKLLREKTGYPVFIDNDVNVIALAEYMYGAGKGSKNMVCLTLGTGVGGGLILNKKLYHGTSLNAGEIGHYTISNAKNAPLCGCGNRGCLEAFIGNRRIVEYAQKMVNKNRGSLLLKLANGDKEKLTPKLIAEAASKGDKISQEIWKYVGDCLGIVLAGTINLLNPDKIVIGGGVSKAGKILFAHIRESTRSRALRVPFEAVEIVSGKLGGKAGIIGGATLVFEKMKRR
ncbi:ROK family protein, partial [Candidatus Auribacterota bacterium]